MTSVLSSLSLDSAPIEIRMALAATGKINNRVAMRHKSFDMRITGCLTGIQKVCRPRAKKNLLSLSIIYRRLDCDLVQALKGYRRCKYISADLRHSLLCEARDREQVAVLEPNPDKWSDPIFSVEDPIHVAALLIIGVAQLDGDVTAEQKKVATRVHGPYSIRVPSGETAAGHLVAVFWWYFGARDSICK